MPIINMPGVGGTVGLREASRRAADGYTISQIHEGLLTATETGITDLSWDDFEPIALMTASPQYLVVHPSENYSNLEEFVAYAKAHPGEITMGVTLGGVPHLDAAMIEQAYGLKFSYVSYEGTGQRIRALVGGNLDAAIGDISSSKEFVDNGDLVFLAVGSMKRVAETPDVPTFAEKGKELELNVTRGIVMPKGAPKEARDTLEAALEKLSKDETYIKQTKGAGASVDFRGQDGYRAYLSNLDKTVKSPFQGSRAVSEPGHDKQQAREAGEVARLLSYVLLLLASVGLFISASAIPPSRFERLGAGAFPKIVFAGIALVAVIAIVDALRKIPRAGYGRFFAETAGWACRPLPGLHLPRGRWGRA